MITTIEPGLRPSPCKFTVTPLLNVTVWSDGEYTTDVVYVPPRARPTEPAEIPTEDFDVAESLATVVVPLGFRTTAVPGVTSGEPGIDVGGYPEPLLGTVKPKASVASTAAPPLRIVSFFVARTATPIALEAKAMKTSAPLKNLAGSIRQIHFYFHPKSCCDALLG